MMTGLLRKAAMTVCGLAVAATAFAGVPSPGNSTLPARINFVGANGGGVPNAAAPGATATVTVRDLANNPIANSSVVMSFAGCGTDSRFGDTQTGYTVNCPAKTVRGTTDASGVVSFVIVGGGKGLAPFSAAGCASIIADGVSLGAVNVGTYDMNGVAGVGGADLSLWGADFLGGQNPTRSNYDNAAGVGGADLSLWGGVFLAGQSTSSAATYCP